MTKYTGKRVLVTGAGGFIGRHLVEALVDNGAAVSALIWHKEKENNTLDRDLPKDKRERINIQYGELLTADSLPPLFTGIEIIFHLAAINSVPFSLSHPREVLETNIGGLMNVLLAARQCGTGRIVAISSAGVYGQPLRLPVDETHPTSPTSPYAASKIAGEKIALGLFHAFALPVVILRPFNTFGPGQAANAVIPSIIVQALQGGEVKMGRTGVTRDFNYVSNTVDGMMAAGITANIEGEIFNIASGVEHSLHEVIETIETILGSPINIVTEEKRLRPGSSDADRLVGSIAKAREQLHYRPSVSFQEGIRKTVAYYRSSETAG